MISAANWPVRKRVTPCCPRLPLANRSVFPDAAELATLRAWYAGLAVRPAVERYLPAALGDGRSACGVLVRIRRQLVTLARAARAPEPQIADAVVQWFTPRAVRALHAHGIITLAGLTVRIPRRRQWWKAVPGLGAASARTIEAFFAAWPALTEQARALVLANQRSDIVPWEALQLPHEVDGSRGTFRAPAATRTLSASNDYEAVRTWLALHESPATQRTYRREAERLILWAIVERGRALSSLTTEDALAYRAFLRHPSPRGRWVGRVRPRTSPEWRPFNGSLSARSVAHALSRLLGRCSAGSSNSATCSPIRSRG
jgi:hypothetical protein